MSLIRVNAQHVLDEAIERSYAEPVVLYKHSATCSLSFSARAEMLRLAEEGGPPIYELVVQRERPLSNAIAETYGIRHESPQVIILSKNQPVFDTSHRRVTAEAIRAAAANVGREEAA